MGNLKYFENMIEKQMLDLHTAFLAKILNVNGSTAKIQPLGLTREIGGDQKKHAAISGVPIMNQAKYKLSIIDGILNAQTITAGDVAVCVCCDRDITEAVKGINALPPPGHHTMSDCVIVGVL